MIDINDICEKLDLDKSKVINIYEYGSHVYNTNTEYSDKDYIIIYRQIDYKLEYHNIHPEIQATVFNKQGFELAILNNELIALECLFLNDNQKIEKIKFDYNIDIKKLRHIISHNVSNSYVKCKKKLYDNDKYTAHKSLFHCFRMIYFGYQLAKHKKIIDYTGYNYDENYKNFRELYSEICSIDNWVALKNKYQSIMNAKLSKFREIAIK